MSVHLVAAFYYKIKIFDFEMLHWAWQGVSSFAVKRAKTMASTNPHEMLQRGTAAGPVSLLQSDYGSEDNYGTRCMLDQLGAAVYNEIQIL